MHEIVFFDYPRRWKVNKKNQLKAGATTILTLLLIAFVVFAPIGGAKSDDKQSPELMIAAVSSEATIEASIEPETGGEPPGALSINDLDLQRLARAEVGLSSRKIACSPGEGEYGYVQQWENAI